MDELDPNILSMDELERESRKILNMFGHITQEQKGRKDKYILWQIREAEEDNGVKVPDHALVLNDINICELDPDKWNMWRCMWHEEGKGLVKLVDQSPYDFVSLKDLVSY